MNPYISGFINLLYFSLLKFLNQCWNNCNTTLRSRTINLLYNKENLIGRLDQYFYIYFEKFPAPTAETRFLLLCPYLQWNRHTPFGFFTLIFCSALPRNRWMIFIMPALMQKWIIQDLWILPHPWPWNWLRSLCVHSLFFCVLMIPWSQSLEKILIMYQNFSKRNVIILCDS